MTADDGTEHDVDSWIWYNARKAWGQTIAPMLREAFPNGTDADTVRAFLDNLAAEKGEQDDDCAHAPGMFAYLTKVEGFTVDELVNWGQQGFG